MNQRKESTMKAYVKPAKTKDLREDDRIILAHGEVTGHAHEVVLDDLNISELPPAEFFEEPDGRRVLLVTRPCVLRHQEHDPIRLDPVVPQLLRQGDVLLRPMGPGAWEVIRQREYSPEAIRPVLD